MTYAPEQPDVRDRSIGQLIEWAAGELGPSSDSPRLDAEVLLASLVNWPRSSVMAFPERTIPISKTDAYRSLVRRRAEGVPVAHLTGWREFYSLELRVTSATLVPRHETELLVDSVLGRVPLKMRATLLDVGTGTGAIALAVKRQRPRLRVVAVDASEAALAVAMRNGADLGLEVEWAHSNWFDAVADQRFDFIVSNPPYVERNDHRLVGGDLRHEPREALDGGEDGLDAIRDIVSRAPTVMALGGALFLEHGFNQAKAVRRILGEGGFRAIETHRDMAGHERVTVGDVR